MLRAIFIAIIILIGTFYAVISPFYGLLFYLWNAYFRPEEWLFWLDVKSLHLSLIIGWYVVIRSFFSFPNPQISWRTVLLILFLLQAMLGTLTSEHPIVSQVYLPDFIKVIVISYLIVVMVTDRSKFRLTLIVISLSLGLECAKQGWASLILAPGQKNDNNIGFLGDNNGVALGTMMLVPIIGALAQTTRTRWKQFAYWFIAVGVFLRGFTTYSRGGFLAAAVLGLFVFARAEKKVRALIGVALVAGLVVTVMPREYWNRIDTITAEEDNRDESAAGRLHFWRIGVEMARAKPFTGVGLNSFSPSYATYDPNSFWGEGRQAHSTWFGVLAELGVPGLAIFLANLSLAFLSCRRIVLQTRDDPDARDLRIYANALLTSFVVFAVGGTFLSSQYNEMLWHFFALSTALSLVRTAEVEARERTVEVALPMGRYAVAR
ncbi:MAG TPA: putative O-glycosylation ligase, exosortase A system-associated [Vicinamibacterales bacterium]|nr:putative O-glycosylation ligase, exosortase A system-associated [Vicinamibacterales bacterium]